MTTTAIKDASFKTLRTVELGDPQRYGYTALRIKRDALIGTLEAEARKLSVAINYEHELTDILEDRADGIKCRFSNGIVQLCR